MEDKIVKVLNSYTNVILATCRFAYLRCSCECRKVSILTFIQKCLSCFFFTLLLTETVTVYLIPKYYRSKLERREFNQR